MNGGSLIIEQTEALVSIDVNGGHGVFGQASSQEKAILEVNLAAARQVCWVIFLHMAEFFVRVDLIYFLCNQNAYHDSHYTKVLCWNLSFLLYPRLCILLSYVGRCVLQLYCTREGHCIPSAFFVLIFEHNYFFEAVAVACLKII